MRVPSGTWGVIVLGSAFLIGAVVWLLVNPNLVAGAFAAVAATVLAVALVDLVRRTAPRMRLAAPEVTVVDGALRVGEEFGLSYHQTWKRATDVGRVRLELLLRETVNSRGRWYAAHKAIVDESSPSRRHRSHDRLSSTAAP